MAHTFNTSLKHVASKYVRLMDVSVTAASVGKSIEENPHYPSLLSLTETFSRFRIRNKAFEVRPEDLEQLVPPFIAYIKTPDSGKDFVLVTEITTDKVSYVHRKVQAISKEKFLLRYQNVVWVAFPDEQSGEIDFDKRRAREKVNLNKKIAWAAGLAFLVLVALLADLNSGNAVAFLCIGVLKFIGSAAAVLLVTYESNKENAFVKNICSAGRQLNCDAVLNGKASKVFGISWSEIGGFYFISTTLWLLVPGVGFGEKVMWIVLLNAVAVPYTLFSIYYQWVVVKQWCPLCLTVQVVLWGELIWALVNFWMAPHLWYWGDAFVAVFLSGLVILTWYAIKPLIKGANNAVFYETAYRRLQYSPEVFKGLLEQQATAPGGWQQIAISVGNPAAPHTIIKVCNPYCVPCAKAHPLLEEIIQQRDDVKLVIIFSVRDDRGRTAARHLMRIAAEGDGLKTRAALEEWYSRLGHAGFVEEHPLDEGLEARLEAMRKWCEAAEIAYTPTLFVNGYRLPESYSAEDLKWLF
jgi:uncharacterized membrane protein